MKCMIRRCRDGCRVGCLGIAAACGIAASADGQIFQRGYGTQQQEIQLDITDTRECEYATVGYRTVTTTPVGGFNTTHALKYDRDGTMIWSYIYNTQQGQTVGYTIDQAENSDFLLGAESEFGGGALGKWLVRIDNNGVPQWSRLLSGTPFLPSIAPSQPSLGVSVRELSNRAIATVNRRQVGLGVGRHGLLHVNDAVGALLTGRVYVPVGGVEIPELDFAEVREARGSIGGGTSEPDLFIVGNTYDESAGRYAAVVLRVKRNGDIIWARKYLHPIDSVSITADGFAIDATGDVVFAGRRGPAVRGQSSPQDTIVAKVDGVTGAFVWATDVANFTVGYQAVEYVRGREIMLAGTGRGGTVFPFRGASILKFGIVSGGYLDGQLYGGLGPNDDERGYDAIESRAWHGYNLIGATNNAGFGAPDIFHVRSYTTLDSGCRERDFKPDTTERPLLEKDLDVVATFDQLNEPVAVVHSFLELGQMIFCYKKPCPGDFNADGLVDDADFSIFVLAYNDLICPTNPNFKCCPADLNGDGLVDDADFRNFVVSYNNLICP